MTEESSTGLRLRGVGVGSILGGVGLAVLSLLLPYAPAAGLLVAVGAGGWLAERRQGETTGIAAGVAAIGGIGLIEATTGFGLGIGPFGLAVLAVGAGVVDIVLGGVFGWAGNDEA